jgi:hypothetical protein
VPDTKFKRKFTDVKAPHKNTIQKRVKKLLRSGVLTDKKNTNRRRTLTEGTLKERCSSAEPTPLSRQGGLHEKQEYLESPRKVNSHYDLTTPQLGTLCSHVIL